MACEVKDLWDHGAKTCTVWSCSSSSFSGPRSISQIISVHFTLSDILRDKRIFLSDCVSRTIAVMASHVTTKRTATVAMQYPVLDFLAPRLLIHPRVRYFSATTTPHAVTPSTPHIQDNPSRTEQSQQNGSKKPRKPLSKAHRDFLDSAVNYVLDTLD